MVTICPINPVAAFMPSSPQTSREPSPFTFSELQQSIRMSLSTAKKGKALSLFIDKLSSEEALAWLSSTLSLVVAELKQLSEVQTILFGFVFWLGVYLGRRPRWRRYTVASDIPSYLFGPRAPKIRGRVVSVVDGDTIRLLHTPSLFHSSRLKKGQKISGNCLPIRLCTIDAPETAKFGQPGQPFGKEATAFLANLISDKIIKIRLLRVDQYGRAVAQVFCGRKGADEVLLKAGLAEVYLGMGAVYGPLGKEKYLKFEREAKNQKLGIWSKRRRESTAEFKKRTKK
jgi:endonuclease YncB( thermonuclease family)